MKKPRFGILGAGVRGVFAFGKLLAERNDCELIALFDINHERMKAAEEQIGMPLKKHTSLEAMFEKESLDVAVVTTPDYLHKEHVMSALRSGLHVLVDKPLATNARDCLDIARAAKETGRTVEVGFNMRHDVVLKKVKELVEENAIGRVIAVENREYYPNGRTYMARWNRSYEKSGGLFCHKGTHDIDIINWLNPNGLPSKVSAFAGIDVFTPDHMPFSLEPGEKPGPYCAVCKVAHKCNDRIPMPERYMGMYEGDARSVDGYNRDTCIYLSDKDTHDNGVLIVEYDNGVRASHWECFFTSAGGRRYTVVGDKGYLETDLHTNVITHYPRWSRDRIEHKLHRPEGTHGGADRLMIDSFLRNIADGKTGADIRDGTLSVLVAEAAEKSRREERIVKAAELISTDELAALENASQA